MMCWSACVLLFACREEYKITGSHFHFACRSFGNRSRSVYKSFLVARVVMVRICRLTRRDLIHGYRALMRLIPGTSSRLCSSRHVAFMLQRISSSLTFKFHPYAPHLENTIYTRCLACPCHKLFVKQIHYITMNNRFILPPGWRIHRYLKWVRRVRPFKIYILTRCPSVSS